MLEGTEFLLFVNAVLVIHSQGKPGVVPLIYSVSEQTSL